MMIVESDAGAVLRAGDGIAVLLACADAARAARDRAADAALRAATGRGDIMIERRQSGRPRLSPPYAELGVSLSRRGGLVLAGFAPAQPIGVDLEIDDPELEPARLAADHFSTAEARVIAGLAEAKARDAFLRCWVAKEAALKTTGRGIFDGLSDPELANVLDGLARDGAVVELPTAGKLPVLLLSVRSMRVGGACVYCALAIAV